MPTEAGCTKCLKKEHLSPSATAKGAKLASGHRVKCSYHSRLETNCCTSLRLFVFVLFLIAGSVLARILVGRAIQILVGVQILRKVVVPLKLMPYIWVRAETPITFSFLLTRRDAPLRSCEAFPQTRSFPSHGVRWSLTISAPLCGTGLQPRRVYCM